MPRRIRTRNRLSKRLNEIRTLRNRVFHHQRIAHWPNLPKCHADLLESIVWINPEFLKVLTLADHFQNVHAAGLESIRGKLGESKPADALLQEPACAAVQICSPIRFRVESKRTRRTDGRVMPRLAGNI